MATGIATLDFGAFPGKSHATVDVTGQAAIVAGSLVEAWLRPEATADHSADEHMLETLQVVARDISAGVGFTIHGVNYSDLFEIPPGSEISPKAGRRGKGTRLYGTWSVAWAWN